MWLCLNCINSPLCSTAPCCFERGQPSTRPSVRNQCEGQEPWRQQVLRSGRCMWEVWRMRSLKRCSRGPSSRSETFRTSRWVACVWTVLCDMVQFSVVSTDLQTGVDLPFARLVIGILVYSAWNCSISCAVWGKKTKCGVIVFGIFNYFIYIHFFVSKMVLFFVLF